MPTLEVFAVTTTVRAHGIVYINVPVHLEFPTIEYDPPLFERD